MSKAENLVIMFTDIVGFTELTSTQSREQNRNMLRQHEKLLMGVAKKFGGKRIKSIGDALLIVYKSPTDAVHCAMAMQDTLWEHNQSLENDDEKLRIRVSLNSGEVRIGEPVNVAARLEGITPANEVYFTESIYLSMNKAEVPHEFVGKHSLKGIPEEITVYRVPRGASAQRLIAVGSDEDAENQYPFGGMHRKESTSESSISIPDNLPIKKIGIGAAGLAALALVAWLTSSINFSSGTGYAELSSAKAKVLQEYNSLLDTNDYKTVKDKLTKTLAKKPNDAIAQFIQGHVQIRSRDFNQALTSYGTALDTHATLSEDQRYADNLIKAMPHNGKMVTELAKAYPSEQVVNAMSARVVATGFNGRRDAAYILREMDRGDKIDTVGMAVLDFKEYKKCDQRLAAINILKKRKDPRGLEVLVATDKEASSVVNLFKKICGAKEMKEAIETIKS